MILDNEKQEIPVLLSIRDFAKKHQFMSENAIRWLLFKDEPGIEDCLVRVSRSIYIDETKFFNFLQLNHTKKNGRSNAS